MLQKIRIYKKQVGDDFDADYLQVKSFEHAVGYLGIVGSTNSDYHYFNSLIYEQNRTNKFRGILFNIKYIERIPKNKFCETDYRFVKSKRFKRFEEQTKQRINKKTFDFSKYKNEINKQLFFGLTMKVGCYGKKSVQIYKNNVCIENHFEKMTNAKSVEQIVDFINNKFK